MALLRRRDVALALLPSLGLARQALRLPKLHRVSLGFESGRLHEMDPSYEDGCLWFWGRGGPEVIRYDPAAGRAEKIGIPAPDAASAALLKLHFHPLSKNGKLHLTDLRQPTDRLPVYDIARRETRFHPLPQGVGKLPVTLQNGIVSRLSPNVYLFVADPPGLIVWDTLRQSGEFVRYPADAPGPWGGVESTDGRTLWIPNPNDRALTRFDVGQRRWTGYWKSPFGEGSQPSAIGISGDTFFAPDLDEGRILLFDMRREQWLPAVAVPGRGRTYGVLGGGAVYRGVIYACLSTYRGYTPPGGPLGVDGKPYHFLDRYVSYEPRSRRMAFLTLSPPESGAYWLSCYALVLGKHLYFTAANLLRADGVVDQAGRGEAAVFQTHPAGRPDLEPEFEGVAAFGVSTVMPGPAARR